MYVRNAKSTTIDFKYKVNGEVKSAKIAPNTIVEFPTVTSINEVVFTPHEQAQRKVISKLGRTIDTGIEYRMTPGLTGATL
jgi:hypothetical protein